MRVSQVPTLSVYLPPHHSVSMLARPLHGECLRGRRRPVRKSERALDRPAGRSGRRRHGARQRRHPGAHRLRSDDDPGGRQPPHQFRRQAAAADAHAGAGAAHRLCRRRPHQARRRGRIHAHGDAAARRRGRRERAAARPARGAHAVGQRGERAGRRFPARPGVQDDGRGRQPQGAGNPLLGRRRDRRRRSHAARRRQEHGDDRGRIYRGHPRQDRRAVRRGLRSRARCSRRGRRPSRPPAARSA